MIRSMEKKEINSNMAGDKSNQRRFQRRPALEIGLQSKETLDKQRMEKDPSKQSNFSKQTHNRENSGSIFKW